MWQGSRDRDNSNVQSAAMGPIPRSKERILVKIKFESRPVLMSKYHDSLLFMVIYREALDRLCVRLNMYLVTYKLVFGLIDLNMSHFFILRSDERNRGHKYKLFIPSCSSSARYNFFTYRAAKIWNYLPADTTGFSSLNSFKRSLNSKVLARYCKVYFF